MSLLKFLGHDSGHKGARHWRAQRLGALALIPLTTWFVSALAFLPDYRFETMHAWAAVPWRALLVSLLVFCMAWHSQLGVQVVIEDYVPGKSARSWALRFNTLAHLLLGAAGIFAAASIAFKG
ncbi:MAG: succinate dehydrogenase, hydrophobic membrane anchor protein [Pseudomonadota bacterium]